MQIAGSFIHNMVNNEEQHEIEAAIKKMYLNGYQATISEDRIDEILWEHTRECLHKSWEEEKRKKIWEERAKKVDKVLEEDRKRRDKEWERLNKMLLERQKNKR